jgi:hypothetical protein
MWLTGKMLRRMALLLCSMSAILNLAPSASMTAASPDTVVLRRGQGQRMTYPPNFESPFPLTPLQKERAWMYHLLWWSISRCLCDEARKVCQASFPSSHPSTSIAFPSATLMRSPPPGVFIHFRPIQLPHRQSLHATPVPPPPLPHPHPTPSPDREPIYDVCILSRFTQQT